MDLLLALSPGSVVDTPALRRAGLDDRRVTSLVRDGHLLRVSRGWYAVGAAPTPQSAHRLAAQAATQGYAGRAVLSHYSALVDRGLPTFRADLATVHLTRTQSLHSRRRPGLVIHRRPPLGAWRDGQLTVSFVIAQTATTCGPMAALIAADAALQRNLVSRAELLAAADLVKGHPRTALLSGFLGLADARCQSPGETRLRHAFHVMGLPVASQVVITDGRRSATVDFMLTDHPVIGEFDGLVKYRRTRPADGFPAGYDEIVAEKGREDWLRGLGFEFVRTVWTDFDDVSSLARRTCSAIERTRGRPSPEAWLRARDLATAREAALR